MGSLEKMSDFINRSINIISHFSKENAWTISKPIETQIKAKIEARGVALREWDINIYRGILTGYNDAFIINSTTREELIRQSGSTDLSEIIRPILRGRDIQKYSAQWDNLYIIGTFPSLHIDIEKYPAIKDHLLSFGIQRLAQTGDIGARKKTHNQWFETQDSISYWEDFSKHKIVWKRVGSVLRFSYDTTGVFCLDSTCFATGQDLKFLVGYLNSTISRRELLNNAPKTGTGDIITSVQALEPLLIPNATTQQKNEIANLVDMCISALEQNLQADITDFESKIDSIIFEIFNFDEDERAYLSTR
jgi:hypothetical protein